MEGRTDGGGVSRTGLVTVVDVRTGGRVKFRPITRLSPLEAETPNEHTCDGQLCFCFSKTMNSIFGTLQLRSFNLFLFYLTSVVFSMYWKSRRGKCLGLFIFTI